MDKTIATLEFRSSIDAMKFGNLVTKFIHDKTDIGYEIRPDSFKGVSNISVILCSPTNEQEAVIKSFCDGYSAAYGEVNNG